MTRWTLVFTVSLSCLVVLIVGIILDQLTLASTSPLFAAFMTTSVLGATLGSASTWQHLAGNKQKIAYVICLYVGWRFAYFPIMVLAGTGAAYAEATALMVGIHPWVYPPFLVLMATLHAIVASVAGRALITQSLRSWTLSALAIAPAVAVSLSQVVDLHPLPDRCWNVTPRDLTARKPVSNPYLTALDRPEYPLQQRLLLFAAGSTYDWIPNAPWSKSVKGTLEGLFVKNPLGSSADRVKEHYIGYLAAHSHINEVDDQD
jgi:hypothetical protein